MNKKFTLKTSDEVNKKQLIKESVTKTEDGYMVKTFVEIPQSLVRSLTSKAKTETGKDPKELLGDTDIAELIVQYVNKTFINIDSIPSSAILFSASDKKAQPAQAVQPASDIQAVEVQPTIQVQPGAQTAQPVNAQEELPQGFVQEGLENKSIKIFNTFEKSKSNKKVLDQAIDLYMDNKNQGINFIKKLVIDYAKTNKLDYDGLETDLNKPIKAYLKDGALLEGFVQEGLKMIPDDMINQLTNLGFKQMSQNDITVYQNASPNSMIYNNTDGTILLYGYALDSTEDGNALVILNNEGEEMNTISNPTISDIKQYIN